MHPTRILVVEDNLGDIDVLRFALNAQGEEYELEILRDGGEALQFVDDHRTGERKPAPCLIILDLHLPKRDGLEILQAIAKTPPLRHVRVLVMSGIASPAEENRINQLGGIYRDKPNSLEEHIKLAAEMLALCKESRIAAAATA